jgi:hypothetical protein
MTKQSRRLAVAAALVAMQVVPIRAAHADGDALATDGDFGTFLRVARVPLDRLLAPDAFAPAAGPDAATMSGAPLALGWSEGHTPHPPSAGHPSVAHAFVRAPGAGVVAAPVVDVPPLTPMTQLRLSGGSTQVPEPGSYALLGTGIVGLAIVLRRRRR